jgi:hypothetical protein
MASVGDFLRSLSREEVAQLNPAEFYKLVEYVVIHEDRAVSTNSSLSVVREAVAEWCCGSFHHWDLIESSPWFLDEETEKPDIRRFVARFRQTFAAQRRQVDKELESITEEVLAELFSDD